MLFIYTVCCVLENFSKEARQEIDILKELVGKIHFSSFLWKRPQVAEWQAIFFVRYMHVAVNAVIRHRYSDLHPELASDSLSNMFLTDSGS